MLNLDNDDSLACVWGALVESPVSVVPLSIHKQTGLSVSKVLSCLKKMEEIDIAFLSEDGWSPRTPLSSISWARAIEIGIPLYVLENTTSLSVQEKNKAKKNIESGLIDKERLARQQKKMETKKSIIRGRAATRAAATDLARIVQDAQVALSKEPSPVNDLFCSEAQKALELLIRALEK